MKKNIFLKFSIFFLFLMVCLSNTKAITSISTEELSQPIQQLTNIRKQFMSLGASGYFNHCNEQTKEDIIKLAQTYIDEIPTVNKALNQYKAQYTDKFSQRKINTLIAATRYLEDMGSNLIDYLSTKELEPQYKFYNIHLQLNQFIKEILDDVLNADY